MWPMARAEDIFSNLNGAKYISTLNLHAGYHHIPLDEDTILKTAFISLLGKYKYLKVPFGLAQVPTYFQELMNKVLKNLTFAIAYLDDIIIYRKTAEEHFDHPQQDFHAGYHHIPLDEDSILKTAFISPFGKYKYLKVPFGLAQVPTYFQELMNKVLKNLTFAIAYLDDIIIYRKTAEEHFDHPQQDFHKLCEAELSMKLSKCHVFAKGIQYFGHVLSTTGIKPLPYKMTSIKWIKPLKNAKQLKAFCRLVCYYCKLIKNFARKAKPFTALTHHDAMFVWT